MKSLLALMLTLFQALAPATAQDAGSPEWKISDIQSSFVKKIDGVNGAAVADKSSIVEVTGNVSHLLAPIAGSYLPIPAIKLLGVFTEQATGQRLAIDPLAVGVNTPAGCTSYHLLNMTAGNGITGDAIGEAVRIDRADGKTQVSVRGVASLCFAFSIPPSLYDLNLEFAGTKHALVANSANNRVLVAPLLPSVSPVPPGVPTPPSCKPVEPNYPLAARQAHIQGPVTVEVIVQKDGSMTPTRVLTGLGYGLDEEAMSVLSKWSCTPGKLNGQPVAVQIRVVVNFHLY
jgi:TonB family protein